MATSTDIFVLRLSELILFIEQNNRLPNGKKNNSEKCLDSFIFHCKRDYHWNIKECRGKLKNEDFNKLWKEFLDDNVDLFEKYIRNVENLPSIYDGYDKSNLKKYNMEMLKNIIKMEGITLKKNPKKDIIIKIIQRHNDKMEYIKNNPKNINFKKLKIMFPPIEY